MASTDPGPRSAASLLADPADDLPRWRDRLERLWRRQVEEIIELSLAYHEAALTEHAGNHRELAAARSRRLQQTRARTASAHHALAEIEAALARIDTASYGILRAVRGAAASGLAGGQPAAPLLPTMPSAAARARTSAPRRAGPGASR